MSSLDPSTLLGRVVLGEHRLDVVARSDDALVVFGATSVVDGGPYTVVIARNVRVATASTALETATRHAVERAVGLPAVVPLLSARAVHDSDAHWLGAVRRGEPGRSLGELTRGVPLLLVEVARLLAPLADALARLHELGLVHGAVAPASVCVRGDGPPALDFFGLSPVADVAGGVRGPAALVARAYQPPELRGDNPTAPGPWSDVYGLARLASALLAEPLALEASSEGAPTPADLPSPRALGASVPDRVEAVLRRALAQAPSVRPHDAREIVRELTLAIGEPARSARDITLNVSPDVGTTTAPLPGVAPPSRTPAPVAAPSAPTTKASTSTRAVTWALGLGLGVMGAALLGSLALLWLRPGAALVALPSLTGTPRVDEPGPPALDPAPQSSGRLAPLPQGAQPTASPGDRQALVPVFADDPARGRSDAPVTLVLFGDLTCPFTARTIGELPSLEQKYGDSLRTVFKYFPLTERAHADEAANAAQGVFTTGGPRAFWLFLEEAARTPDGLDAGRLEEIGIKAGVRAGATTSFTTRRELDAAVARDQKLGLRLGLRGTPVLFVNGRRLEGAQALDALSREIDLELHRARESLAKGTPPDKLYAARVFANVTSTQGDRLPD